MRLTVMIGRMRFVKKQRRKNILSTITIEDGANVIYS